MTLTEKFEKIADWSAQNKDIEINKLKKGSGVSFFEKIESQIDEKLPDDFKELYNNVNGEDGESYGVLFGNRFLEADEVVLQLEFGVELLKPKDRKILNEEKSNAIIELIILAFRNSIVIEKWERATFECSPGTYSGIRVYDFNGDRTDASAKNEYQNQIFQLIKEINLLEKESYNWDTLEFEIAFDGTYKVKRTDYVWEEHIDFTSTPPLAIRKKYFHHKWIPIFYDYGGNFIGMDLDPDEQGTKGQIIVFGRDEENMFVIANSLDEFFDFAIQEMNKSSSPFHEDLHLHEIFKKIKYGG